MKCLNICLDTSLVKFTYIHCVPKKVTPKFNSL